MGNNKVLEKHLGHKYWWGSFLEKIIYCRRENKRGCLLICQHASGSPGRRWCGWGNGKKWMHVRDTPEDGQNVVIKKVWMWRRWDVRNGPCLWHEQSNGCGAIFWDRKSWIKSKMGMEVLFSLVVVMMGWVRGKNLTSFLNELSLSCMRDI